MNGLIIALVIGTIFFIPGLIYFILYRLGWGCQPAFIESSRGGPYRFINPKKATKNEKENLVFYVFIHFLGVIITALLYLFG